MIRRRVVVHGKVQGVFFRETARWAAEQHGVSGWVRNNDDGTVEAVFEGSEEAVAEATAVVEARSTVFRRTARASPSGVEMSGGTRRLA